MQKTLGILIVLVLGAGVAHAQRAPDMATLDRGDGISKLGLDAGLSFLDGPYDLALRFEVHGQYVARSGLGFYGALPFSASFGAPGEAEDPEPPDLIPNDAFSVGGLDLGGLYVVTKSPSWSLVLRGGLALPTASSGRDEAATRAAATAPRLTDAALAIDAWYVRLGASPLIYANKLFMRFDLGVDLAVDDGVDSMLRFNLGAGYDFGRVALGLELVNLVAFAEPDEDLSHTLTGTLRFMGEALQPFLAVGAPLDASAVDLFVFGGIQVVP